MIEHPTSSSKGSCSLLAAAASSSDEHSRSLAACLLLRQQLFLVLTTTSTSLALSSSVLLDASFLPQLAMTLLVSPTAAPVYACCQALHLIPESPLFNSLVMQDHHVNELIKRQRLELQATVNPLECPVHKRLRVYIYNTHSHQHSAETAEQQQGVSADSREHPQWTLVVWGRLENPDPPAAPKPLPAAGVAETGSSTAGNASAAAVAAGGSAASEQAGAPAVNVSTLPPQPAAPHSTQKQLFSGFFKRIDFQLDPDQYPDSSTITWEKLQHRCVACLP